MISQPVSSIFPCFPLTSVTWQTPGLSIPWCCLPTTFSDCFIFFPFHCAFQDGFGQTWWTGDMTIPCGMVRKVPLPAGSLHRLPRLAKPNSSLQWYRQVITLLWISRPTPWRGLRWAVRSVTFITSFRTDRHVALFFSGGRQVDLSLQILAFK